MKNKEAIYDNEISPLMTQIIKICIDNKIAMMANFYIPSPEDENIQCCTNLPDETGKIPERHAKAVSLLRAGRTSEKPLMITTINADGSKTLTAVFN